MKYHKKIKMATMLVVFVLVAASASMAVEAKIISKKAELDKRIVTVGYTATPSAGRNLSVKSGKKKASAKQVKKVLTYTSTDYFSYRTKAYHSEKKAYKSAEAYSDATDGAVKYLTYNQYDVCFLKPGTYTVSYDRYQKRDLEMIPAKESEDGTAYYNLYDNDEDKNCSEELFVEKTLNGERYFEGVTSHQIYSRGSENYYSYDVVPAAIRKGADGKDYLFYQPKDVIKTTYQTVYKVLKTTSPVASVQLGKAKRTESVKSDGYNTTTTVSTNMFLSGKKGRLTVKMSDKNFAITSIIVGTYDKEGEIVYQKVNNKKQITYGTGKEKYQYQYDSSYIDYGYKTFRTSMYKPTIIYVGYRNKFTGEFSTFDILTNEKTGKQRIKSTYRRKGDTEDRTYEGGFSGLCYEIYRFYKK